MNARIRTVSMQSTLSPFPHSDKVNVPNKNVQSIHQNSQRIFDAETPVSCDWHFLCGFSSVPCFTNWSLSQLRAGVLPRCLYFLLFFVFKKSIQ